MQISQQKQEFSPITLAIESELDARALWEAIDVGSNHSTNLSDGQQAKL